MEDNIKDFDYDLIVVWRVNSNCNLACPFCAFSKELVLKREEASETEALALSTIFAEYALQTNCSVHLSFLGGEPFLWKPLAKILETVKDKQGLSLGITTNGTRIDDPRILDLITDRFEQVTISLDGLETFHDSIRRCAGLWQKIRKGIYQLRERAGEKLLIRVNTILMRENIDSFPELCAELASWGVTQLTFNQLGGRDRPEFYPTNRLLPIQVERFSQNLPRLLEEYSKRGMTVVGASEYLFRMRQSARDLPIAVADCEPGQQMIFIDPNNRASPCAFTQDEYGLQIRNVQDIYHLSEHFKAARSNQRAAACDNCMATHVFKKFLVRTEAMRKIDNTVEELWEVRP